MVSWVRALVSSQAAGWMLPGALLGCPPSAPSSGARPAPREGVRGPKVWLRGEVVAVGSARLSLTGPLAWHHSPTRGAGDQEEAPARSRGQGTVVDGIDVTPLDFSTSRLADAGLDDRGDGELLEDCGHGVRDEWVLVVPPPPGLAVWGADERPLARAGLECAAPLEPL